MLSNSRERSSTLRLKIGLQEQAKMLQSREVFPRRMIFRYVLLNHLLQPLRSMTHIQTITAAQKLINNIALM